MTCSKVTLEGVVLLHAPDQDDEDEVRLPGDAVARLHFGQPLHPLLEALQVDGALLVDAAYRAAPRAGGTDNGAPKLRVDIHPTYRAGFVRDPDRHNVECVCQS